MIRLVRRRSVGKVGDAEDLISFLAQLELATHLPRSGARRQISSCTLLAAALRAVVSLEAEIF